jgi:very-short-patch-repair endonuclease
MHRQHVTRREEAIAKLASRQHGAATRAQLAERGVGFGAVDHRVKTGRWRVLHRGVYLLGPTITAYTWDMAAVLACDPDAFLSHQSAGWLYRALPYVPKPELRHVTVAGRNPGRRRGIAVHRVSSFEPSEVSRRFGIPVTSPARTILDLACELEDANLEQAIAECFARNQLSRSALLRQLELQPGHRGASRVRARLGQTPALTRSRAERRLLTAIRGAGLPEAKVNTRLGPWEVDLLWPGLRLAVEVDGYSSHSSPRAFERDYRKTAELERAGYRVLRVSADQVRDEIDAVIARIAQGLGWRTLDEWPVDGA